MAARGSPHSCAPQSPRPFERVQLEPGVGLIGSLQTRPVSVDQPSADNRICGPHRVAVSNMGSIGGHEITRARRSLRRPGRRAAAGPAGGAALVPS